MAHKRSAAAHNVDEYEAFMRSAEYGAPRRPLRRPQLL